MEGWEALQFGFFGFFFLSSEELFKWKLPQKRPDILLLTCSTMLGTEWTLNKCRGKVNRKSYGSAVSSRSGAELGQ